MAFSKREIILDNMQPIVWAATVPFAVFCFISCVLRLYARRFIAKAFGADDWFMLLGLFVWMGQQYIAWMWTILGGGLHIDQAPVDAVPRIYVYLFAEEFYYLLLQFIIKQSFLCFYYRTICTTVRFRNTLFAVMALVVIQTVGTWIFYGLQCIPIQAFFNPQQYPDAVCVSSSTSYYLPTVANVTVDIIIYVLPIMPVWNMQAPRKRRLQLLALFTLGGGAIVISLLRFIVLWQLANTQDYTYVFGSVTIITSIEFTAAIITANTPGMAAFYKHWRTNVRKRHNSDRECFDLQPRNIVVPERGKPYASGGLSSEGGLKACTMTDSKEALVKTEGGLKVGASCSRTEIRA